MKTRRERLLYGTLQQALFGLMQLPLTLLRSITEPDSSYKRPRTVPADAIAVAIFCALSYEATAVKCCLDEELACHPRTIGPKNYMYSFGRIGEHKVVIAQPVHMGLVKAAQCAATVRQQFPHVRFALMVGIGAGIPRPNRCDVRLGDIAVGIPRGNHPGVVQYDLGIYEEDRFVPQGCLNKPPSILISADRSLEEDEIMDRSPLREILQDITKTPGFERPIGEDILYDDDFHHFNAGSDCTECEKSDRKKIVLRSPRSCDHPIVHRGLILSGNGVIKTPQDRNRLRRGHDDTICFEMEGAGIADVIPCLVVRGICDYADTHKQDGWHHYAAAVAAAYCKSILLKIDALEVGASNDMGFSLSEQYDLLRAIRTMIQSQSLAPVLWPLKYLLPLETGCDGVDYKQKEWTDLNRLPIAEDASFDSYAGQHEPVCLPGTRIGILQRIEDWVCDERGRCVFYLSGMAGTGKSTISRTVAKRFKEKRMLGASFFFKRDAGDRGHARRLFSTIARQLMTHLPQLAPIITKAVREDPDLSTKSLREQFERLLLLPLIELGRTGKDTTTIVIVIDALDECESDKDVQLVVHLLSQLRDSGVVRPRILLSSRPELPTRQAFSYIAVDEYHDFSLQEVPRPTIEHDMSLFLKHKIAETRNANKLPSNWPLDQDFHMLVTLCVPSFAFAATLCTTLEDPQWDPEEVLSEFLQTPSIGPKLDDIYLPILNRILHGQTKSQQERLLQEFKEVVGPILILQRPLSVESLSRLTGHSEKLIKRRLYSLHSIIDVPDDDILPVEPLHWSLQAFLFSPRSREMAPFWIDEKEMHNKLTIQCLKLMQCTFEKGIHHSLPALALQYACQYWVHHLSNSTDSVHQLDTVFPFLQEHFFHWVQIMSVFSDRSTITDMVDRLQSIKHDHVVSKFLENAKKSVIGNRGGRLDDDDDDTRHT
ncbi:hypothetical protein ASPBRDRAFT_463731 [Aspergillus brasiliensis CBS 101740]|uniref:NACHT domain-containing protein n=1 Tax=Aspergillus brasiliensis (strain CBS 101740 / IMI 381727 / IBT 21946) TaxID=767769 RepID=A0A1L9UTH9_ASPBC|nr:hypothetical protein ASPBRDRAFT_463731 [Aspergillus brasiliensis CBS 101740]